MSNCPECGKPWKEHGTACQPIKDERTPFKCPVCDGYTKIPSRSDGLIPIDPSGKFGEQFVDCPACDGEGVIWR